MQKLKQIPKRVHHFLIGLVLTAVLGVLAFAVVNTYTCLLYTSPSPRDA